MSPCNSKRTTILFHIFQEKANIEYYKIAETQKFDQAIAGYKAQINSFQAEKKRLSMTLDEKKEQERHEHDKACKSPVFLLLAWLVKVAPLSPFINPLTTYIHT